MKCRQKAGANKKQTWQTDTSFQMKNYTNIGSQPEPSEKELE